MLERASGTPAGEPERIALPERRCSGPKLRLGVIGLGVWGSRLLRAFARLERTQLVALCDRDPGCLTRAASSLGPDAQPVLRTPSAEALLGSRTIDAVVIATRPESHAALVLAALDRGLHVFVEKPLATSIEDTRAIEARAEAVGSTVMVGHILEHHPAVIAIQELIATRALGDPRAMVCRRLGVGSPDESAWWSLAPHDLGLVSRLLGAPQSIRVRAHPRGGDHRLASISTERGRVKLEVGYGHAGKVRSMTVICGRGLLRFDDLEPVHKLRVLNADGHWQPIAIDGTEPLLLEARRFEASVLEGVDPLTGVRHAAEVVRWLAWGDASLRSGTTLHRPLREASMRAGGEAPNRATAPSAAPSPRIFEGPLAVV